jgi:hypothetical protein
VTLRPILDALLVVWVLAWIAMGIAVGREASKLADVSDAARDAGVATQRAGDLLGSLTDLPVVGDRLREPADSIRRAGASTVARAERSHREAEALAVLLGVSIAVIPNLPLLVFYLPGRLALQRERRLVREHLADPALQELLATRAVAHLPLPRLRAISADPLADLREGRHTELADAELDRLGLSRAARAR